MKPARYVFSILLVFTAPGFATVTVTSPAPNSTVTSPVHYVASASASTCPAGVSSMGIYVNNKLVYPTHGAKQIDTELTLSAGPQHTVVQEWDHCGASTFTTVNITVKPSTPPTITAISVSPSGASIAVDGTLQFAATATYSDGSTASVTSTATWADVNTAVATISSTGFATGVATGSTGVSASLNGVTGNTLLTVTPTSTNTGVSIPTWHGDNSRSGLNASEASLSPANVVPQTFGKLFSYLVDGYVYGEPLLISNLTINGSLHNVLYAATEHDSVYAFDADSYGSGAPLWKVSLLKAGEKPQSSVVIEPTKGVTSTPVIDLASNTMYVVSEQTPAGHNSIYRLSALDITTGAQKFGGPVTIQASVPGTNAGAVNGIVSLKNNCVQRAALLLANNTVYIGFGSCQNGWLLAYDATTLAQTGVFNASPNLNTSGSYGGSGGIWMGGGGPVADDAGNVYVATGDGPWDGKTAWSDSVLKFNAQLQMEDYFTPSNYGYLECNDADLAGGGLLLIPGTTEILGGGKSGKLYLVNGADLGKEQLNDAGATQTLWYESDLVAPYTSHCTDKSGSYSSDVDAMENFGTAAYFNGAVYLGVTPTSTKRTVGMREFTYSGTLTPSDYTTIPGIQKESYGTTPFISANGATNGIVWMIDHGLPLQNPLPPTRATLRAFDATNLANELYNSGTNPADVPGYGIKFSSPIVGNGKVYISTAHDLVTATSPQGELDVYGLK